MSGISRVTGDNIGGVGAIYIALQRDLSALFDFDLERENLTISSANLALHFSQLHHLLRSAAYNFDGPNGDTYINKMQAVFTQGRAEVRAYLKSHEHSQVCLIFQTLNGEWLILPFATEVAQYLTGEEPKDRNGYTIGWESEVPYPALAITIT